MPYFECAQCGQLVDLSRFDQSPIRQHCPVCEEETTWEPAFDSDRGVSY